MRRKINRLPEFQTVQNVMSMHFLWGRVLSHYSFSMGKLKTGPKFPEQSRRLSISIFFFTTWLMKDALKVENTCLVIVHCLKVNIIMFLQVLNLIHFYHGGPYQSISCPYHWRAFSELLVKTAVMNPFWAILSADSHRSFFPKKSVEHILRIFFLCCHMAILGSAHSGHIYWCISRELFWN